MYGRYSKHSARDADRSTCIHTSIECHHRMMEGDKLSPAERTWWLARQRVRESDGSSSMSYSSLWARVMLRHDLWHWENRHNFTHILIYLYFKRTRSHSSLIFHLFTKAKYAPTRVNMFPDVNCVLCPDLSPTTCICVCVRLRHSVCITTCTCSYQ